MPTQYKLEFKGGQKTIIAEAKDFKLIEIVKDKLIDGGITFDLECPICGSSMGHVDTEDDGGGFTNDMYTCDECGTAVTYITPNKYEQYHEVPDSDSVFHLNLTETWYDE